MGFLTKIASILKRSGKEGQHTIEYAVLMILIMAGIITMGRYVIRSWNANLKGWEDSAIDSMEDPLRRADPPPPGVCTAGGWADLGCGYGFVNVCSGNLVRCAPTEMTSRQVYNPPGCQCATCAGDSCIIQCTPNSCCCETPVAIGCGTTPGGAQLPACTSTGLSPTNDDGSCNWGFMGYSTICGGNTYYGCRSDPVCLIYCPLQLLPVGAGASGFFPRTPEGQFGSTNCPLTHTGGPPTRECLTGGVWGPLQNPCVLACPDGFCDSLIGENCNSCPADCGVPRTYGAYSWCDPVCPNNSCESGEDCQNCSQDCPGTYVCNPGPYGPICGC